MLSNFPIAGDKQRHNGLLISNWDLQPLYKAKPEAMLDRAIRPLNCREGAQALWRLFPHLREATRQFAVHVTDQWPSGNSLQSLLQQQICKAVQEVQGVSPMEDAYSMRISATYLYWLTYTAEEVLQFEAWGQTPRGEHLRWNHFSEPLLEWTQRHNMRQVEIRHSNLYAQRVKGAMRQVILGRVMTIGDLALMRKFTPLG